MFRDDTNAVFHVCNYSAARTLANDLDMSRDIVANILGHASLSNTAYYAHARPDALLDIATRKSQLKFAKRRAAFGRPFLSKGDSSHVYRETNDLHDAAGRLRDLDGHQRSA